MTPTIFKCCARSATERKGLGLPRIRTLKPEHRQHRKIGPLTDRQYRLWVGMLCEADDEGRLVADAAQLRLVVFGYHPKVKVSHVAEAMEALQAAGLVHLYTVNDTRYAEFPSWRDHQYIQKRHQSKLPPPQHSAPNTIPLPYRSGSDTVGSRIKDQGSDQGSEGSEPIGREGCGEGGSPSAMSTSTIVMRGSAALGWASVRKALAAGASTLPPFRDERVPRVLEAMGGWEVLRRLQHRDTPQSAFMASRREFTELYEAMQA